MLAKGALPRIPFTHSLIITLLMALGFTLVDYFQFPEPIQSVLSFLPAFVSLYALYAAGVSSTELNLRISALSGWGLIVLVATMVLLLPILGSSTAWVGWRWLPGLVYAPASGIAQELYFRCALLSGLTRAFGGRKMIALVVHSMIFIGFHLRTFQAIPAPMIGLVVAMVLFLAGCGWGWQVQRDRTVVWAMLQHSIFLMLMSIFEWS